MSLGLYLPGRSPIHRLPAAWKLSLLAIASISLFLMQTLSGLTIGLGLTLLLLRIAQIPVKTIWRQVRPVLPLLIGLLVIHGLLQDWQIGLMIVLRFLVLLLLASLITLTTRLSDLVDTLEQLLHPLGRFGVQPARVSLMLAIAIRFIPVLLDQARTIQEAQWARGCDRYFLALLVPLLVKTLQLADELTDALDARCPEDEG